MTSKQRAYLKKLASVLEPVFQIGKSGTTPESIAAIAEALEKRELIKVSVLKNCEQEPADAARTVAERTQSELVQVIGRKAVFYKPASDKKDRKIVLPV